MATDASSAQSGRRQLKSGKAALMGEVGVVVLAMVGNALQGVLQP